MSCRRRPLHTCGVSLMEMGHNVYKRAQRLNWPIGSLTDKLSTFSSPLVYAFQYHLLSILSSLDYRLLSFQNRVEAIFPPSRYVFDGIDGVVQMVETLPAKFNEALDHRVPLLDWALWHAVSWLDFCIFVLADLLKEGPRERDIVIDIKCDDQNVSKSESGSPRWSEVVIPGLLKGSYKEVLEKGTRESAQEKLHWESGENVKKSKRGGGSDAGGWWWREGNKAGGNERGRERAGGSGEKLSNIGDGSGSKTGREREE